MAYRMVCAPQVIDLESERGHPHVHSESLIHNGNDLSDQGGQYTVRVVGNATNAGLSDTQGYYNMSMNHPHQPVHNSPPNLGVDSGFVFPSSMYNPCMSTSMNRYVSHAQSFGLPLNQVVLGSIDGSTRNENVSETARGFIKRKNATAGSCHVNGFASSGSSSHTSQNPTHRPWDPSFESNVFPNVTPFNPSEYHNHSTWPSVEGSSITGTNGFNSMAAHPESAQHGNYTFQSSHASQCFQPASTTWVSQAATGIAEGVPQWTYINAISSVPGRFAHSGVTEIVNGGFHEYQNGPSTISQGHLPYFHQHAVHSMQAHNPLDHTQVQVPYQQGHNNGVLHTGVNHSGNRFHLGPRTPGLFSNSERSFGPPQHPFLVNPVNHRNIRILPPLQRGAIMDFSGLYEGSNVVDEHRDMRLDIDSMTYEELLALEEHIGDVNTGLAKSHIVDKLKTSLYAPGATCMSNQSSESSTESEACIICQVLPFHYSVCCLSHVKF
ncbi:E3 ubiquitin ligase BIG BROTHER-related protein [Hordeum vulgare]|nr:E3 ubiquitin ligase BIG BROTHER-related protein [Hordeum vulgare]